MSYLSTLEWFKDFGRYDEKTKRILMALSERQYKFRNLSTLHKVSGMDSFTLDSILKNLESRGVIFIRKHGTSNRIIVGLRERQDTLPTAMLLYTIGGVIHDSFVVEYSKKSTEPLFEDYLRKNVPHRLKDEDIEEIMKVGHYKWKSNDAEHIINITNTKIIPF